VSDSERNPAKTVITERSPKVSNRRAAPVFDAFSVGLMRVAVGDNTANCVK
jgi:hypothetical protein